MGGKITAKIIDRIKEETIGNIYTNEELDTILEGEKYYPVEIDEEDEEGILKYTNSRSQLWVKYIRDDYDYLVLSVSMKTKKSGKTTVHAFKDPKDIKNMMDYFRENKQYDNFLIFILDMFLARRIGDTLSLKWSDFYYQNGNRIEILDTLIEQKTNKIVDISISIYVWEYIDWYCGITGTKPMENFSEDIFRSDYKDNVKALPKFTKQEKKEYHEAYNKAIKKQASSFRYFFKKAADDNDIKWVSTHSLRKSFGYIAHEINKYDPDCLPTLQSLLGHSSMETTKIYCDIINEKAIKMFNDVSQYVWDIDHGEVPVIEKKIVITLKTMDFRDLLVEAGVDDIRKLNELLRKAEQLSL